MTMAEFLASFFGGGIGAAIISFLAKDWLALRIGAAIDREALIHAAAFDVKRTACLDALAVVDAAFSQRDWDDNGRKVDVARQMLDIAEARKAYNNLALTCTNPRIIELYAESLSLKAPGESPKIMSADKIVDLRNAMRVELGFGKNLDFDRSKAWIANLDGADK